MSARFVQDLNYHHQMLPGQTGVPDVSHPDQNGNGQVVQHLPALEAGLRLPKFLINFVGSTAVKTAWRTKLQLLQQLGENVVNEHVAFIGVDAAAQHSSRFDEGREFLHLTVEDVEGIMLNLPQHTIINGELPGLRSVEAVGKIYDGVQGQPIFGAFALLKNARSLTQAITSQLTRLGGNATVLHIVSPLGGVAPGVLTREVYLVRDLCREVLASPANHHICFLMLPVKGEQSKTADREEMIQLRNFQFALRQIEEFTTPGRAFDAKISDNQICSQAPLFDLMMGVGPNLGRDRVATDLAELEMSAASFVAHYISGDLDETFRQRTADHKTLITSQVRGKNRRLVVGGQVTLGVPLLEIQQALASCGVRRVAKELENQAREKDSKAGAETITKSYKEAIDEAHLRAEDVQRMFAAAVKTKLHARPDRDSVDGDPSTKLNDHHADLLSELNQAEEGLSNLKVKTVANFFARLAKLAPTAANGALKWWCNTQKQLEREANRCVAEAKTARQSARNHQVDFDDRTRKAADLLGNSFLAVLRFVFGVFRAEPMVAEAVDSMYRSRDALAYAVAFDAAGQVLRDLAGEIRKRRTASIALARTVLKRCSGEPEPFSSPADVIPIVGRRHLPKLESAFATSDSSFTPLEERFGPIIDWGVSFAGDEGAFYSQVLESQMKQFSPVLQTSAIDYLVGPLAERLGLDGAAVLATARKQLVGSANYSLAAIPDEDELPEATLASFAASRDEAVTSKMQEILELRENCIQKQGHPEYITLMVARFGATLGMLTSAPKWRNAFSKALELEGSDVLQIYGDRTLEELSDPLFDAPDTIKS